MRHNFLPFVYETHDHLGFYNVQFVQDFGTYKKDEKVLKLEVAYGTPNSNGVGYMCGNGKKQDFDVTPTATSR